MPLLLLLQEREKWRCAQGVRDCKKGARRDGGVKEAGSQLPHATGQTARVHWLRPLLLLLPAYHLLFNYDV
eukprot:1142488-Pelagomonas_calceolata.AAC.12